MKTGKRVSVIIPCYNSAKWIRETLDSVYRQMYQDIEVIVVDDGSTDETSRIMETYPKEITYIRQINQGPSAARNHGIRMAKGEYLAFLDSDDLWTEDKLEKQVGFMESHPEVALNFTNVRVVSQDLKYLFTNRNKVSEDRDILMRDLFLGRITMNTPSIMVRTSVVREPGGFDELLPMKEDHDFLMKIANTHDIFHFKEPMVLRRIHEDSISHDIKPVSTIDLFKPFIVKSIAAYPILKAYENKAYAIVYASASVKYWKTGNHKESRKLMEKAIAYDRTNLKNLLTYVFLRLNLDHARYLQLKSMKRFVMR